MNLRKCLAVLLFVVLWSQAAALNVHAQNYSTIKIFLDGQEIISDVSPYIVPKVDTTLVPLRVISEGLGAAVDWKQSSKSVTISWPET
ncbi:copper amine oxidase N-terminal domain-containing protein, partial [Paenibacillus sepulcri]|nr:copper amine oxidase N-terminal domain-containing protein [Paenibacillus sepulcri]